MCLGKYLWLRLHATPKGICNSKSPFPESRELSCFCLSNKQTGSKVKWRHKGFRTANRTLRKNQVELTRSTQDSPKPAIIKALNVRKRTWRNSVEHNRRTRKMSLLAHHWPYEAKVIGLRGSIHSNELCYNNQKFTLRKKSELWVSIETSHFHKNRAKYECKTVKFP